MSSLGEERGIAVGGQRIRVNVRRGTGVPLVLCNGLGVGLESLDPLVAQLRPDSTVVRFDVPGIGGSAASIMPYGLPYLAWLLGRVLARLGIDVADLLGLSWGGLLAQQFALQNPRRCHRLVLAATATGVLMVPGRFWKWLGVLTPRRFADADYAAYVLGQLYGGVARVSGNEAVRQYLRMQTGSRVGYLYQLLAGSVWTSLFVLPAVRQETLIVAGTDDPIIPVVNARIMNALMPHSQLYLHAGGHIDLLFNAAPLAPVIESFRRESTYGGG